MKCVRCEREFDDSVARRSATTYGGPNFLACPHCGKLYSYKMTLQVDAVPDNLYFSYKETDDWGNNIVKDIKYYQEHNKEWL